VNLGWGLVMAHECENCGQSCDCEGDDTHRPWPYGTDPDECGCPCWEEELMDDDVEVN
jgi:hypothetical protein